MHIPSVDVPNIHDDDMRGAVSLEIPDSTDEASRDIDDWLDKKLTDAGFDITKPYACKYSCTLRGRIYIQTKRQRG